MVTFYACLFFVIVGCCWCGENLNTIPGMDELDDRIVAIVDTMLARQASVYDERILKLELKIQSQNRNINSLENKVRRQGNAINNLRSRLNVLTERREAKGQESTVLTNFVPFDKYAIRDVYDEQRTKSRQIASREMRTSGILKKRAIGVSENVAFTAYTDHDIEHLTDGYTVKFNRVHLNDGNGYNTFTGIFTVQVSGVYLFSFHWASDESKTVLELVIDGVQQAAGITQPISGESSAGQTVIVHANAGQAVWIENRLVGNGDLTSDPAWQFGSFAGVLLY